MSKRNVTPYITRATGTQTCTKVHQSLLALASCLALLLAPACSPGDSSPSDDPPSTRSGTTTTAEPTTTTLSPQDEVEQAYEEFLDMFDRITTTTVDPNDPELAMRMADPALGGLRTLLSTWQAEGQVWVAGDQTRHTIESVVVHRDGLTAEVTDCAVGNDALVQRGTTPVTFPPAQTNRGVTTMVNQNGRWLVQDTDSHGHWEGVAGCAA
jgi:hypothetical protein